MHSLQRGDGLERLAQRVLVQLEAAHVQAGSFSGQQRLTLGTGLASEGALKMSKELKLDQGCGVFSGAGLSRVVHSISRIWFKLCL